MRRGERYRGTRKSAQRILYLWRGGHQLIRGGEDYYCTIRVLTDAKERAWLEAKMTIAYGHDNEINALLSL